MEVNDTAYKHTHTGTHMHNNPTPTVDFNNPFCDSSICMQFWNLWHLPAIFHVMVQEHNQHQHDGQ